MSVGLRRGLLLPGLLFTALATAHCSSSSSGDDDDGGDGGQSGETAKGGSAGSTACTPRETRSCDGLNGCTGREVCTTMRTWTGCACGAAGSATAGGGQAGQGESGNAGEGGVLGDSGASGKAGETGSAGNGEGGGGAKGGSGGHGGAKGGTGGSGGSPGCGANAGYVIVPEATDGVEQSGFVHASTNCMGISGPVTFSHDALGSTITAQSISTELCVTGHLEQVTSAHPADEVWGAKISIQLNNPDSAEVPGSYSGLDHGVHGFKFTLSGDELPPEIRPTYRITVTDTPYCKRVCASGLQSALYSESDAYCEDDTGALQSGVAMTMLEFVIPAKSSGDVDYDFCIEDITGITDNTSVGDPGTCI